MLLKQDVIDTMVDNSNPRMIVESLYSVRWDFEMAASFTYMLSIGSRAQDVHLRQEVNSLWDLQLMRALLPLRALRDPPPSMSGRKAESMV